MNQTLDVLLAAGGAEWERQALENLESSDRLRLLRRCVDVSDLLAASITHPADIAFVDVGLLGLDLDVVTRLQERGLDVWGVESAAPQIGITRSVPVTNLGTVDAAPPASVAVESPYESDRSNPTGSVVCVWGPDGGPGVTTIAISLAAAAARAGSRTVLMDADLRVGAISQSLGILDDVSGLLAASRTVNQGRSEELAKHLVTVLPGLEVLTGLPRPDLWHHVPPVVLQRLLDELRTRCDLVVVDAGGGLGEESLTGTNRADSTRQIWSSADQLLLIGRPDPVGLARLLRAHEMCRDSTRVEIVLNGIRPSLGWAENELAQMVENVTGRRPGAVLPFDIEACDRAAMAGDTVTEIAPGSALSRALGELAESVLADGVLAHEPER